MAEVVTFELFTPPARYDNLPWTAIRIEESDAEDGIYTLLETITISPVDADPESPAAQSFTTELGTAIDYWYRITFVDADGDLSQPTTPIQNTSGSTIGAPYSTVTELARILKFRTPPTAEQTIALNRVLVAAAGEIDSEIDLGGATLTGWQLSLAAEVNLERAAELWKQQEVQFNLVGIGSEFGPTHLARNTWEPYAYKLAPLKGQWGLA